MLIKLVSGGQTGADRAALDAALACCVPCGGWCPEDRTAEDGPIPPHYPVTPLPGAGYRHRTRKNVEDSDGTVILSFGPPEGGTRTTLDDCVEAHKPYLVIDADATTTANAAIEIVAFVLGHGIGVLNVAGPRVSKQPAIYSYVYDTLYDAMRRLQADKEEPG